MTTEFTMYFIWTAIGLVAVTNCWIFQDFTLQENEKR